MGIVFQIKDDILGIHADEDNIGKNVGSDITEFKKLYYMHTYGNDIIRFDLVSKTEKDLTFHHVEYLPKEYVHREKCYNCSGHYLVQLWGKEEI